MKQRQPENPSWSEMDMPRNRTLIGRALLLSWMIVGIGDMAMSADPSRSGAHQSLKDYPDATIGATDGATGYHSPCSPTAGRS